jgi:hypothetical protein
MWLYLQDVITDLDANPIALPDVPVDGAMAHSGILQAAWNVAEIIQNQRILDRAFDCVESVSDNFRSWFEFDFTYNITYNVYRRDAMSVVRRRHEVQIMQLKYNQADCQVNAGLLVLLN